MISHEDLYRLGYDIKTRDVNLKKGSNDYRISGEKDSKYLINLTDGVANIIFPNNSKKSQISFDNLEDFEKWHDQENGFEE